MASNDPTVKRSKDVVILGAGVIGLTIAHVLSDDPETIHNITVVARDIPPENLDSQAWASPWAGANWSPIGGYDERKYRWESKTFQRLWDMIPTGRAMELPSRAYYADEKDTQNIWWKDIVRDFRVLPLFESFPLNTKAGVAFTTLSINAPLYMQWLKSELDTRGVKFIRKTVNSLEEAAASGPPGSIVINATALGARSLLGVEDTDVYPIRGQTMIVHAPEVKEFLEVASDLNDNAESTGDATYIIPRPTPEGTVLLGGTFQPNNWDTSLSMATARGIIERCSVLAPALKSHGFRILSHGVGLRPARRNGARVEVEWVQWPLRGPLVPEPLVSESSRGSEPKEKAMVVHAYGFGPAGYQNSWGVAEEVADLVRSNPP